MTGRTPPIGSLRDRVQLQQKTMLAEGEGGHQALYVPLATVWARVAPLAGHVRTEADARAVRASHMVVTRFRTDLNPGDRIIYRGRGLEVLSADDLNGRRAYLSCACSEMQVTG
ncbi:phage head closure protein [Mariluticola halotolerans]|uniref:phage head closure protein n=1 Tax=Mariluticola halotolerans TaxID=2909283 RepID=UPI0026E1B2F8|nr:phage head closure protein [Mariluticola halotolerans]UJQ95732.1 phage head closure protein [Mariluticola halotolerans]